MTNERNIPIGSPAEVVTSTILINGEPIPGSIGISSIQLVKSVNHISAASIIIRDGSAADEDFAISSGEWFVPGNEIEIQLGYSSDEHSLFKGVVVKHGLKTRRNRSSVLKVECRDKAYQMTLKKKSRYFHELTDSELCEELIAAYPLEMGTIESTNFTHARLVQVHSSDWDFLLARANACGKMLFTDDGVVHFRAPDLASEPVLSLTYGANILSFDAELDARTQWGRVVGESWDGASQELLSQEAADNPVTESGNLSSADLAEQAGLEEQLFKHAGQLSAEELQSWIDTEWLKSKLSKLRGQVSFYGFSEVKPGDLVELQGLGDRFNGLVWVSAVRHDVSQGNWTTHLQLGMEDDWLEKWSKDSQKGFVPNVIPPIQGLQVGIVSALQDDPEGEFRVQVRLPLVSSDDEGIWSRIATLDAGENRGTFFLPEIGDEVIVGFLNNDPRDAIVLGMLNSSSKPAAFDVSDENPEKGYVSREGLKVVFNDDEKSITIATLEGKTMQLSEDSGQVLLEDEHGNSFSMSDSGIEVASSSDMVFKANGNIEFEGTNLELKSNAQLVLSGAASTELNSSGVLKIEGSLVQIN